MKKQWQYLINQFENVTNNSFKKAVKISNYHDAALFSKKETEPLLISLYDRYHPLHTALVHEYNTWKTAGGSQEGQTLNVEQLLDVSYKKIQQWDVMVQATDAVFLKGTPNHLALFINGRNSFSKGSIDARINAYDTLAKNMEPFVILDAIRVEVAATYVLLDEARELQLGAKGTVKTGSGKVETARVAAMTMQWRNLGFAIDAFWNEPKYIESMFDLDTLRESRQNTFVGTLNPAENKAIVTHTFLGDDELRIKNNGNATVHFYLASHPNVANSDVITVAPNANVMVLISEFGVLDLGKHRFLTAVNESTILKTHYEVTML